MPTKIIMPQLGESVVEGTLTRWLKNVGDPINEYEPLLEINTDKVDSEIPSPASGTLLEVLVPEGTTITAGTLLGLIGTEEEARQEKAPVAQQTAPAQAEQPAPASQQVAPIVQQTALTQAHTAGNGQEGGLGFISPVVSKIAQEHKVDLSQVKGTGMGGRITKKDVLAYIDQRQSQPAVSIAQAPKPVPAAAPMPAPIPAPAAEMPGEVVPLSPVRRAIAEHMVFSKRTSPHVTTVMEADLSKIVKHREANKAAFAQDSVNLTFTPYFVTATAKALQTYPMVNSSWSDDGIILHKPVNIGMATSLGEAGLIVPVIKSAADYSLLGLARLVNDLANRARTKQLKPDEVKGGTFTITNHGTSGSLFATPIINQPQCGILGVGMIQKRVVVIEDAIAIRPMVYLSFTFDHRILDGGSADHFLAKVVEVLQTWSV